jgi:CDP-glucose 4,6-dehydratase
VHDLLAGNSGAIWNVGPDFDSHATVKQIQEMVAANFGKPKNMVQIEKSELHEANFLSLDSSKLRNSLSWQNKYSLEEAVKETTTWHSRVANGEAPEVVSQELVKNFLKK